MEFGGGDLEPLGKLSLERMRGRKKSLGLPQRRFGGLKFNRLECRFLFSTGCRKGKPAKNLPTVERAISANNISGLGLGLFIAREIVEGHGGQIQVESQITKGATFKVRLPLSCGEASRG